MNIVILFIQILAGILGSLALLISIPLFFRFHWPAAVMWGLKLYVSALSPILALVAIVTGIAGVSTGSIFLSLVGFVGTLIYMVHFISVTRPPRPSTGFEQAFGPIGKAGSLPKTGNIFYPHVRF